MFVDAQHDLLWPPLPSTFQTDGQLSNICTLEIFDAWPPNQSCKHNKPEGQLRPGCTFVNWCVMIGMIEKTHHFLQDLAKNESPRYIYIYIYICISLYIYTCLRPRILKPMITFSGVLCFCSPQLALSSCYSIPPSEKKKKNKKKISPRRPTRIKLATDQSSDHLPT